MNSLYQQANFLTSVPRLAIAPPDSGWEVAFAGRSNAGKSSAINAITSQKGLAKTSKTPGRTQQLVFFKLDDDRRLVDLPGYGYAKAPASVIKTWRKTTENYLTSRKSLCGIFLLVDIRRALTDFDFQMIDFCEFGQIPLHIALAKADKFKRGRARGIFTDVQKQLEKLRTPWSLQLFSAVDRVGIEIAHRALDSWLEID